ncbi:hypothetical protein GGQ84_001580 [Desulfitispora alkaliphila]|uniref:hypothetical protein n=1 Tax=Desulfitispora alkaliphila TaxID=622674 RepID=UPI003D1C650B
MGDFLGLIIFIVFIIARLLSQQKQDNRPKRGQQPRTAPKPVETPQGSSMEQKKETQKEEDWFPIPDDIKDLFDFPVKEEKPKPKPEPKPRTTGTAPVEKRYEHQGLNKPDLSEGGLVHAEEIGAADLTQSNKSIVVPRKRRHQQTAIGGGIQVSASAVTQGIIWSEVLQPPKSRRRQINMRR